MNATLKLKNWDLFENSDAYQEICSYLVRCNVEPGEVLFEGDSFKSWNVQALGLSMIYRLEADEVGRITSVLEVCMGALNPQFAEATKEFLLQYNRSLYDFKICISKEKFHIIGTHVCRPDEVKIETYRRILNELVGFGEHFKDLLKPFQTLPLSECG